MQAPCAPYTRAGGVVWGELLTESQLPLDPEQKLSRVCCVLSLALVGTCTLYSGVAQ